MNKRGSRGSWQVVEQAAFEIGQTSERLPTSSRLYAFSETALGKRGSPAESNDPFTPQLERAPFPTTCCRLARPKGLSGYLPQPQRNLAVILARLGEHRVQRSIDGMRNSASSSSMRLPAGPPKMPYSCYRQTTSA
jgi:hypothetical protein